MLGWKFFPQSDNNKNVLTKITCANIFLALCVKPLSLEETLICLKIILLSDKFFLAQLSTAALTSSRECSDGLSSVDLCLYFMISHCGGDIMINQFH